MVDEVDETTGTYYAARRVFLKDGGNEGDNNPLQPPPEFMTRKQMRNFLRVNRGSGLEGLRTLDCFKDSENIESKKEKKRKEQEGRQRSKQPVYDLKRFSSTKKEDWVEQIQAGCRMWINHDTGEVSAECPYEEEHQEVNVENISNDFGLATGNLVYDNSDLIDFFELLDAETKKETLKK